MKEESRARVVLVLDAIILSLGFIIISVVLLSPSLISQLVREYYAQNSEQLEGVHVMDENHDQIRDLSVSVAEKYFIYIYAVFLLILGILFGVLYVGVTKKSPGQLHCWVLVHCVLLTTMILSTIWTLASTPKLIVYHIPDLIYMCYRIVTLMIIREFRTVIRVARQLTNYNVQYSMTT